MSGMYIMSGRHPRFLDDVCGPFCWSNTALCDDVGCITMFSPDGQMRVQGGETIRNDEVFFSFPQSFLFPRLCYIII